jgi:hypothetical protein
MSDFAHPEQSGERPVRILSIPADRTVIVRFLAGYGGLLTHFYGKQTIACRGDGACPPAAHRGKSIWKAYGPVEEWSQQEELWIPWVLEVTEGMDHQFHGRKLRGETWVLSRLDGKKGSPVGCLYSEKTDEKRLRKAFDVMPIVSRVYHSARIVLGTANPIPAPMRLAPSEGDAPSIMTEMAAQLGQDPVVSEAVRKRFSQQLQDLRTKTSSTSNGHGSNGHGSNGQAKPEGGGM